ncbi:MAG: hypothetical protein QGH20_07100, partial [Candidatus Latescibacteria bacterium]|nr:hypothetical protein [Candidatus Latescibacterota bacterium]
TGRSGFSVTPEVGYSDIGAWKSYTLQTDGGGAESRGVELTVSKALSPQAKMIDFGGRVAYAFSSVRAKAGGGGAANKNGYSANSDGIVNLGVRDDYDWVLKRRQASGSDFGVETGFDRTHRINAVLQAAFPFGLSLATTIEGASGFLYDITTASDVDPRERQVGEAPWTWQADLRVEDTQKLGSVSATVFVEIRNLLDRENILTWDGGTNPDVARQIWEDTHNPHGNLNRATRSEGTPIYDIAREMYAGVRVSF